MQPEPGAPAGTGRVRCVRSNAPLALPPAMSSIRSCAPLAAGSKAAGVPEAKSSTPLNARRSSPLGAPAFPMMITAFEMVVPPWQTGASVVEVVEVVEVDVVDVSVVELDDVVEVELDVEVVDAVLEVTVDVLVLVVVLSVVDVVAASVVLVVGADVLVVVAVVLVVDAVVLVVDSVVLVVDVSEVVVVPAVGSYMSCASMSSPRSTAIVGGW